MKSMSSFLDTTLLTSICFSHCWSPAHAACNLTSLIEGLCRRRSTFDLDLSGTISSEHTHYLVLLLTTCPIGLFQLTGTDIRKEFPLFAAAMKHNRSVDQLWLSSCNLKDRALIDLGKALQHRKAFCFILLVVNGNHFSSSAVQEFLRSQYCSMLAKLDIGRPLNREEKVIYHQICMYRASIGIPMFSVVNRMAPFSIKSVMQLASTLYSLPHNIRTRTPEDS